MQQCEEITAIVRKVCCSSLAGRVSQCRPHTEGQRAIAQLFQVKGSNLTQKPGHSPRACPFTQHIMSTHRNQEHSFPGSRLVASCSITKNNVRRMQSGKQEEDSEKVTESYVTASRSSMLLKLKKFLQNFEKKVTKQNCWRANSKFQQKNASQ